jgi:hypothetical protein
MFEIYAATANDYPHIVAQIADPGLIPHGAGSDRMPFLQCGYDEVPEEQLDRILEYASIATTNGPVGLPRNFAPISRPPDWVLFPINGLRRHLTKVRQSSELCAASADFCEAVDQIAGYCETNDLLMIFRW